MNVETEVISAIRPQKPYRLPAIRNQITATLLNPICNSNALGLFIVIDAAIGALSINTAGVGEGGVVVSRAVDVLLEDGVLLEGLELGLEVLQAGSVAAAIGSAAGVGHGEAFVLDFFSIDTPAELRVSLSHYGLMSEGKFQ